MSKNVFIQYNLFLNKSNCKILKVCIRFQVSSLKCGLLPLSQESLVIGEVSQHHYLGSVSEPEEKEKIARNLGPMNKVIYIVCQQ